MRQLVIKVLNNFSLISILFRVRRKYGLVSLNINNSCGKVGIYVLEFYHFSN